MKMRTFRLDKLVRDGIVESTEKQSGLVEYVELAGDKKTNALIDKITEEVREYKESKDISELAQIIGIFDEIIDHLGLSEEQIRTIENNKQKELGGYTKGHYIKTVSLPSSNKWANYYANDPEKYKEIDD